MVLAVPHCIFSQQPASHHPSAACELFDTQRNFGLFQEDDVDPRLRPAQEIPLIGAD
jgi:hypothetical protein